MFQEPGTPEEAKEGGGAAGVGSVPSAESSLVLQLSATIDWLPWVPRGASLNEWAYIYPQLTRSVYQLKWYAPPQR